MACAVWSEAAQSDGRQVRILDEHPFADPFGGIGKTFHLALDWDHGESPPHGRLADSLVSEAAVSLSAVDVRARRAKTVNPLHGFGDGNEPRKPPLARLP